MRRQLEVEKLKKFKEGHKIRFHGTLKCPLCITALSLDYVIVASWPYIHTDYNMKCLRCGFEALFGIPEDPVIGMELIVWDTHPDEVLKRALQEEKPVCPFHLRKMKLTKIFGDMLMDDETVIRLQWKCNVWFLTEHRTVKRDVF